MSHPWWERIRLGTDYLVDQAPSPVPDALALEDRVLFNAAPVDLAAVAEEAADSSTLDGVVGTGASAGNGGLGSAADQHQGLLADNQYLSVNPEDRIVAQFSLGGTPNPEFRNLGWNLPNTGWEVFIDNHLQPVIDAGVSRIELHTPFGPRSYVIDPETGYASAAPGERGFQFDAYLDAQTEVPKVTEDFVSAFQEFFAEQKVTGQVDEVIAYIGSPRLDPDQVALEGDPGAWWDRVYDVLTPMFEAGFRSIGFDASAPAMPDTLDFALHDVLRYPELRDPVRDARLIEVIGDEPVEVYLEAMSRHETGRSDYPLYLLDWAYVKQDPERPGAHFESRQQFYEHDRLTGEVIRMVRHEQWQAEGAAPVERILLEGNTAAITPTFFLRPERSGAETLDEFIDTLDLPSLPTLIDLDPDDLNSATAEYQITAGPKFGTLTPNRFHADVFTYTPNPYFTGVDSLQYTVRDDSGATATAVVKLFVNTEVVLPSEPTAPPIATPPEAGAGSPPVTAPVTPPVPPVPQVPGGTPDGPSGDSASPAPPEFPEATNGDRTDRPGPAVPPDGSSGPSPGQPSVPQPNPGSPPDPLPPLELPAGDPPTSQAPPAAASPPPSAGDQEPPTDAPNEVDKGSLRAPRGPISNGIILPKPSAGAGHAPADLPAPAGEDDPYHDSVLEPRGSTIKTVRELLSRAAPPPDGGRFAAPIAPPQSTEFVFLPHANRLDTQPLAAAWNETASAKRASAMAEPEDLGFFAGIHSVPANDDPRTRALVVNNSASVLQFLLSEIRSWLPPR